MLMLATPSRRKFLMSNEIKKIEEKEEEANKKRSGS